MSDDIDDDKKEPSKNNVIVLDEVKADPFIFDDEMKAEKALRPLDGPAQIFEFPTRPEIALETIPGAVDPCTEISNAYRIKTHFGTTILSVTEIGWHIWGPPWRHDEAEAMRLCQGLGKIIENEAETLREQLMQYVQFDNPQKGGKKSAISNRIAELGKLVHARYSWAVKSEGVGTIRASIFAASNMICERAANLDANHDLFSCKNGVFDLGEMIFRNHRQLDRITKVAGFAYDANATAPTWQTFLTRILGDTEGLTDYMQQLCGYMLSGYRDEQLLPVFYGSGKNGKSTFVDVLLTLFGDYGMPAPAGLLMASHENDHPARLALLQGRRFIPASESGEGRRLAEDTVKAMTGGDMITARHLHKGFFSFVPTHQIILQTNHKPIIRGTDIGIWRRLRLIPFLAFIADAERDPDLAKKLKAELPGIFNWCLEGLRSYRAHGFNTPAAVVEHTDQYRAESDQVGRFIEDRTESDPAYKVGATALYRAYKQWCEDNGERPKTQNAFGTGLTERGYAAAKGTGNIGMRLGLRVIQTDEGIFEGF